MSFATTAQRSASQHRIVVELDIGTERIDWVNHGAGIWVADFENNYPWVDSSLLDGFEAVDTKPIGSLKIDGLPAQEGASVLDLADTPNAWYYEGDVRRLYITCPNFDEPSLHTIYIGEVYAYSDRAFAPIDARAYVDGRMLNTPSVSRSRDPLFFGRMMFPSTSIQLANGDGEFDSWGNAVDIYGNDVRVFLGFEDVSYTHWLRVWTGFLERVTVGEDQISISASDKRKQLTAPITYSCTNTNALTAIEEMLAQAYSYTYDSTFFDTTAWEAARGNVENVTIDMQEPEPTIEMIEYVAASVFGLFTVDADNLFTFKVIDETDTIADWIDENDILGPHSITYDPTEVVSSVRVGYARDWTSDAASAYTYYTDTSREQTVFNTYKTYNQREFLTALPSLSAATAFATRVLDYVDTVRGSETITVPLKYYGVGLGNQIGVNIQRGAQSMLGELKAEVTGVQYALDYPAMQLTIRHGGTVESLLTDASGSVLKSAADAILTEEA